MGVKQKPAPRTRKKVTKPPVPVVETVVVAENFDYSDELQTIADHVLVTLGHGHTEKIYHMAIAQELKIRGWHVQIEPEIPVTFVDSEGNTMRLGSEFPDILATHTDHPAILVELKAPESDYSDLSFRCQIQKYLREIRYPGITGYGILITKLPRSGHTDFVLRVT